MSKELLAERLAANLDRHRREQGMSLVELAGRAEIHRTHLGILLRGKRLARIDTIVKLASALNLPPSALLAGMGWEPPRDWHPTGHFKTVPDD